MEKIARHYYVASENAAPVQQDCPDKGRVIEQGYNHVYAHAKLLGLDGPQAMFRGIGNIVTSDDGWGKTKIASADISYRLSYVTPTGHGLLDLAVDYLGGKFIVADSIAASKEVRVDLQFRDDDKDRIVANKSAHTALIFALNRDKTPRDDTRKVICETPSTAYYYADAIDGEPRDDTRKAACGSPEFAQKYAENVDKCPRDDTRKAACLDPTHALRYAVRVDQRQHPDTWHAVKDTPYRKIYQQYVTGGGDDLVSYIERHKTSPVKEGSVRVAWEMQQNRPPTPVAYLAERIARMVELTKREPQNIYQDFVKTYPHMTSDIAEELAHEVSMYGYYIKAIKVSAGDGDHLFSTPADMKMQQDKYLGDDMNKKEFTDVFHKGSPEMKPTVIDTAGDPRPKPRGIFAKLLDECYYDNKPGFTCTACGLGEMVQGELNEDGWAPCECDKCGKTELVSGPKEEDE